MISYLKRIWDSANMGCQQAMEVADHPEPSQVGWPERLGARAHVLICGSCRRATRQLQRIRAMLGHVDEPRGESDQEPGLSRKAVDRIKATLEKS